MTFPNCTFENSEIMQEKEEMQRHGSSDSSDMFPQAARMTLSKKKIFIQFNLKYKTLVFYYKKFILAISNALQMSKSQHYSVLHTESTMLLTKALMRKIVKAWCVKAK